MTKLHFVSKINSFENIIFFKPGKLFLIHFLSLDNFCILIHFVFRYIYVFGCIVCIWIYFPLHIWIHFLFLDLKLVSFISYFNVIVCFSPITFLCKFSIVTMFYYRSFFSSRRCQDQMEICHQATFADLQFFACQSLYGSRNLWR